MKLFLDSTDVNAMADAAMREFDQRVAGAGQYDCAPFKAEVTRLESKVEAFYALTATMARHDLDMAQTAALWQQMTRLCDQAARRIGDLTEAHPFCQTSYDRILDLRCAAEARRRLHEAPRA
jgi:cytochrome c556